MAESMIPAGHYQAKAIPDTLTFGKAASGNKQVGVSFEIIEGEYKGRRYPWIGMLVEGESTRITLDTLEAAGVTDYEEDDIRKPIGLGSVPCMLVIEQKVQQKYNDAGELEDVLDAEGNQKIIPSIKYVNALGAVRMKETLDENEAESLAASMQGALAARRAKKTGGKIPTDSNGKPLF